MRRSTFILGSLGSLIPYKLLAQEPWTPARWMDGDLQQRESVLWFTVHFGPSIGAKNALETSGSKYQDHKEKSVGPLGIYLPTAKALRPDLSETELRILLETDWYFSGQLATEIDQANLKRFQKRGALNPELDAAMVYQGWRNWNNPGRLRRGLLDLEWQKFLGQLPG